VVRQRCEFLRVVFGEALSTLLGLSKRRMNQIEALLAAVEMATEVGDVLLPLCHGEPSSSDSSSSSSDSKFANEYENHATPHTAITETNGRYGGMG